MTKEDVIHGLKTLAKQERKAQSLLTRPREAPQEFERWYIAEVLESAVLIIEQRDRLAEELDALKQSMLDLSHPNMKLLLEERKEAREQRDRLAKALREIAEGSQWGRRNAIWIAEQALAAVKGGSHE
jgi:hypothetical protein